MTAAPKPDTLPGIDPHYEALQAKLAAYLTEHYGAPVTISRFILMLGGACQDNYALDFRIGPEIANQNDLVHASRHRRSPISKFTANYWPWDHLEPTLYARRSGGPGDPRVIHI